MAELLIEKSGLNPSRLLASGKIKPEEFVVKMSYKEPSDDDGMNKIVVIVTGSKGYVEDQLGVIKLGELVTVDFSPGTPE
jgi:hypothetical protein